MTIKLSDLVSACNAIRDPDGPPIVRRQLVKFDDNGEIVGACAVGRIALAWKLKIERHNKLPVLWDGGELERRLGLEACSMYDVACRFDEGMSLDDVADYLWTLKVAEAEVDVELPTPVAV